MASISSPNRNSSLRATVSVFSESSAIKIRKKTFTASAIIPIKIMYEATVPANTGTAACKSTPGSFSGPGNSNIFAGPQIDINYDHLTEPGKFLVDEPSYKEAGGTANGYNNFNSGLGFLLTYDSRDVPANAYRGMYLDFRGMMYAKFIGSDQTFYRLEIDYRQYKSPGKRRVLAWTAQTKNVFGDVPLTQYALTGTPFDLRGYYMGQYRDKSSHVVMAEYRQMLNTDRSTWVKRMLNHIGFVAWTGCGFMGPTPGKIEGVLPNYGVGLRIEVQPRMNVRLDLGKNTVNNQMLFYFNMTEAF
ncbi:outer membrane protein assembly factor [Bacteroides uniformis]|nr:outer membrane protein assembly factor [Bacteroides uniformis]